jgi:hypothetical protein
MIFIEIFLYFIFDAPLSPQAPSGSRKSVKKSFAHAYLAAKRVARF